MQRLNFGQLPVYQKHLFHPLVTVINWTLRQTLLLNSSRYLADYTASHSRRQKSSQSLKVEPQILQGRAATSQILPFTAACQQEGQKLRGLNQVVIFVWMMILIYWGRIFITKNWNNFSPVKICLILNINRTVYKFYKVISLLIKSAVI